MDQATLIKEKASGTWGEYATSGGKLRDGPDALPLCEMLYDLAERVFLLTVVEDETLDGTNIEGMFNRDEGLILVRPDLRPDRAIFVIAHEMGHCALEHPLHWIVDTAVEIDDNITPEDLSIERQQRITGMDLSDAALTAVRGYNQRDLYEMQANAFATELLVPGDVVRMAMQCEPDVTVAELASRLGVPGHLVRVGLAQALFTPPHAIPKPTDTVQLDPDQQNAVNSPTPVIVIAGPGAGKTRVLVARFARLVTKGIPPRQILALTFANKAAGEMRERLARMVDKEHAAAIEVSTFHAFGLQLLQQYGERIGLKLPLRLITPMDALLLFRRRAAGMALGVLEDLPKALENLRKMLAAVARSKDENADPDRWEEMARSWREANPDAEVPPWARDGVAFYREYHEILRRYGLLDYGDLQMEALRLFSIPEVAAAIQARYQCILVDEFQDIDFVSGLLVRALDGGRDVVWVVGDPRQSIYGFRGASPVNLSRFRSAEYYPTASVVNLTTNYRSVPDIVAAGMAVPMPSGDPALTPPPLHANREPAGPHPAVTAVHLACERDEVRWIAEEIRRLQAEGRALCDIAVLTRTNRHATKVAAALTAEGISHRWGGPIQNRPVFRVLMSALLLAVDDTAGIVGLTTLSPTATLAPDFPLSEADLRILLAEGRGRGKARRLLAAASGGAIAGLSQAGKEMCCALHQIASALSLSARPHHNLCVYLFEHARWLRGLLRSEAQANADVRAVLATAGQALDLAASFAVQREALKRISEGDQGADHLEMETNTGAFLAYLQAALRSGGLEVPNELDVEGDSVSLMTVHRSKGLEWPVVFIPFCVEGQFPGKERANDLPLPPGLIATDDADAAAAHDREEKCLFYVAVTRARDRLFLTDAKVYGVRTKGTVSKLCQAIIDEPKLTGQINIVDMPTVSPPTSDKKGTAAGTAQECLAYPLEEPVHERDLRMYRECPRKFSFHRIYGLPEVDTAFQAFHACVYGAARDASGDPQKLRELFEAGWKESGPPENHWQAPLLRRMAERLIQRMEDRLRSGTKIAYRQEKTLHFDGEDGTTVGIRFTMDEEGLKPDGKRYSRRHKLGSRRPKAMPDGDIVTLYALFADQEKPEIEISFYYPLLDEDLLPTIGEVKKANLRRNILETIPEIKRGAMPVKPGDHCDRCPYNLICNRIGPE